MIKLGDKVTKFIDFGTDDYSGTREPVVGTVVYIHPLGRFYSVEFEFQHGWEVRRFRQSYALAAQLPDEPVNEQRKKAHSPQRLCPAR